MEQTVNVDPRIARAFKNANGWELEPNLLVLSNVGSISHGTQVLKNDPHDIDDVDIMGIVIPPSDQALGLGKWSSIKEGHWVWPNSNSELEKNAAQELDVVIYSVRKFTSLLRKSNPNVLGLLWIEPLLSDPLWEKWIANRKMFLSKHSYKAFAGYAYSQLMKLGHPSSRGYMGRERKALFQKYGFDPKNSSHLIRLLHMGIELLETGDLNVNRSEIDGEELKAIKSGQWSLTKIQQEAEKGFAKLEAMLETTTLPDEPDNAAIENLLLDTILGKWRIGPEVQKNALERLL
jgi:predicted nucleotidyltransferase